ncbi:MAG: hypothetical protein ACQGVK_11385 [Myxococcota bacterium]
MFHFENLQVRYEPYPIAVVRPVFDESFYAQLLATYPPIELFEQMPKVGHKYSLAEHMNPRAYRDFVASTPPWKDLHAWIKSRAFVDSVERALLDHRIDIWLGERQRTFVKRSRRALRDLRRGRLPSERLRLRTRFEFSALPADGGLVMPHTDTPKKVVTLVVSMVGEGEWNPEWGGGTEVSRPLDASESFNWENRQLPFDQVAPLHTYAFQPNQCILFVKTFNSLHCVRPMTAHGSDVLRRTLTINIEHDE